MCLVMQDSGATTQHRDMRIVVRLYGRIFRHYHHLAVGMYDTPISVHGQVAVIETLFPYGMLNLRNPLGAEHKETIDPIQLQVRWVEKDCRGVQDRFRDILPQPFLDRLDIL